MPYKNIQRKERVKKKLVKLVKDDKTKRASRVAKRHKKKLG